MRSQLDDVEHNFQKIVAKKEDTNYQIDKLRKDIESDEVRILKEQNKISAFWAEIRHEKTKIIPMLTEINPTIEDIIKKSEKEFSLCQQNYTSFLYISFLQHFNELLMQIRASLIVKSFDISIELMEKILNYKNRICPVTKCKNLAAYIKDRTEYWFEMILTKFSDDFLDLLECFKWPFITENTTCDMKTLIKDTQENAHIIDQIAKAIKRICSLPNPKCTVNNFGTQKDLNRNNLVLNLLHIIPLNNVSILSIPLLLPFYKRFVYHFMSQQKTNQLGKPEWYFSQILEWIKLNTPFLYAIIQPILDESEIKIDIQIEFIKGFIYIAQHKLSHDIPLLLYNDGLFSHLVDETVLFHKTLALYGYDLTTPSCIEEFSKKDYFAKWITIEQKSATEKINAFLNSSHAWDCDNLKNEDCDTDNFSPSLRDEEGQNLPKFVEKFFLLLEYYNERYDYIPSPLPKIQFLSLEIELLDDFRIRLLQITHQNTLQNSTFLEIRDKLLPFCLLINSLSSIINLLARWQDTAIFILLAHIKSMYKQYLMQKTKNSLNKGKEELYQEIKQLTEKPELKEQNYFIGEMGISGDDPDIISTLKVPKMDNLSKNDDVIIDDDFYEYLHIHDNLIDSTGDTSNLEIEQINASEDKKCFDDTIELYEMAFEENLAHLIDCVIALWISKLKHYKTQRWNAFPPKNLLVKRELSTEACEVLGALREIMYIIKKVLAPGIFKRFWARTAKFLDTYIYEEVLAANRFNDGGIAQISCDIKEGFFTLFATYGIIPETLFKKTTDAIFVLGLNRGTSLLLVENLRDILLDRKDIQQQTGNIQNKETLTTKKVMDNINDPQQLTQSLEDFGVRHLNGSEVLNLISNRNF